MQASADKASVESNIVFVNDETRCHAQHMLPCACLVYHLQAEHAHTCPRCSASVQVSWLSACVFVVYRIKVVVDGKVRERVVVIEACGVASRQMSTVTCTALLELS